MVGIAQANNENENGKVLYRMNYFKIEMSSLSFRSTFAITFTS